MFGTCVSAEGSTESPWILPGRRGGRGGGKRGEGRVGGRGGRGTGEEEKEEVILGKVRQNQAGPCLMPQFPRACMF